MKQLICLGILVLNNGITAQLLDDQFLNVPKQCEIDSFSRITGLDLETCAKGCLNSSICKAFSYIPGGADDFTCVHTDNIESKPCTDGNIKDFYIKGNCTWEIPSPDTVVTVSQEIGCGTSAPNLIDVPGRTLGYIKKDPGVCRGPNGDAIDQNTYTVLSGSTLESCKEACFKTHFENDPNVLKCVAIEFENDRCELHSTIPQTREARDGALCDEFVIGDFTSECTTLAQDTTLGCGKFVVSSPESCKCMVNDSVDFNECQVITSTPAGLYPRTLVAKHVCAKAIIPAQVSPTLSPVSIQEDTQSPSIASTDSSSLGVLEYSLMSFGGVFLLSSVGFLVLRNHRKKKIRTSLGKPYTLPMSKSDKRELKEQKVGPPPAAAASPKMIRNLYGRLSSLRASKPMMYRFTMRALPKKWVPTLDPVSQKEAYRNKATGEIQSLPPETPKKKKRMIRLPVRMADHSKDKKSPSRVVESNKSKSSTPSMMFAKGLRRYYQGKTKPSDSDKPVLSGYVVDIPKDRSFSPGL